MQRCKRNQKTAGGGSRAFTMPYPACPRTPIFYEGAIKNAGNSLPAREKPRIGVCMPTAAAKVWLNDHLLLQEASRLPFCPRGRAQVDGSVTGTCAVLAKTCCKSHRVPVPHPSAGLVACSANFPLDLPGHCQPPGGTSNRGGEAPLIGRFKEIGYLGEGGNRNPPSPRRFFGDFLSAQKVTRPGGRNHPLLPSCPQAKPSPTTFIPLSTCPNQGFVIKYFPHFWVDTPLCGHPHSNHQ